MSVRLGGWLQLKTGPGLVRSEERAEGAIQHSTDKYLRLCGGSDKGSRGVKGGLMEIQTSPATRERRLIVRIFFLTAYVLGS